MKVTVRRVYRWRQASLTLFSDSANCKTLRRCRAIVSSAVIASLLICDFTPFGEKLSYTDYTREDFTRNGQRYDLILAVNGYHPISDCLRALRPEGIYVVAGGSMLQLYQAAFHERQTSKTGVQETYVVSLVQSQTDLVFMKELLESRKVVPVIDGCYPLNKVVDAMWYFEKEHAQGKIVIVVNPNGR